MLVQLLAVVSGLFEGSLVGFSLQKAPEGGLGGATIAGGVAGLCLHLLLVDAVRNTSAAVYWWVVLYMLLMLPWLFMLVLPYTAIGGRKREFSAQAVVLEYRDAINNTLHQLIPVISSVLALVLVVVMSVALSDDGSDGGTQT